jgi:hypothetical protein
MQTNIIQLAAMFFIIPSLIGCSDGAGQSKKDIVDLKAELATVKNQMADFKSGIDTVNSRLAALEISKMQPEKSDGPRHLSSSELTTLNNVISQCVHVVRNITPTGPLGINEVYVHFDAYYNPASGKVLNNNQYVDQSAVYAFNKCMTSKGIPLS